MAAALGIHTRLDRDPVPTPFRLHPPAAGAPVHVGGHRHRHRRLRIGPAQRVVVHDMVGVVEVDVGAQRLPGAGQIGALESRGIAAAAELAAVHAAPCIAGQTVAGAGGEFQHRVRVQGPAERGIGIPLAPARRHHRPIAVAVVVGLGAVGVQSRVAAAATAAQIQVLVVAVPGADQRAGLAFQGRHGVMRSIALEAHGACGRARPPAHRLRTLDDGEPVEGFRRDVGQGVVHARRTCADQGAIVAEHVEPRAEHAAQHWIAVGAAVADRGEAGHGFQIVGTVAGRHRLPRQLRIDRPGQWRDGRSGGHDHPVEGDGIGCLGAAEGGKQAGEDAARQRRPRGRRQQLGHGSDSRKERCRRA